LEGARLFEVSFFSVKLVDIGWHSADFEIVCVREREIELLFWIMLTNRSLPFLSFAPTKLPTQLLQSAAILEFRVLEHFCNGVVSPVPYISQCLRVTLKERTDRGENNLTIKYINGTPKIVSKLAPKND
jgi:hypothetical protein